MKFRFLPPLWIVCVPLVRVGVLPQPELGAAAPDAAGASEAVRGAFSRGALPSAVPPRVRTSSTASTAIPQRDLVLVIVRLPSSSRGSSRAGPLLVGLAVAGPQDQR